MKKIFISADIEGVTDVVSWGETVPNGHAYNEAARQMSLEVAAACRGAFAAGAEEIVVRDGHDNAMNIDHNLLPRGVKLIRGWGGTLLSMLEGLDESFDGLIYVGYHSEAGSDQNPLAHTSIYPKLAHVWVNGERMSEFMKNSYNAADLGVPVLFISGDAAICKHAQERIPGIGAVAVKTGLGESCCSIHPADACDLIEDGVREAVAGGKGGHIAVPQEIVLRIEYQKQADALAASVYPGVKLISERIIEYEARDVKDMMVTYNYIV